MSKRVAETTTASASASPGDAAGDGSCARQTNGAIVNKILMSQSGFFLHITSFPPFFERRTCLAEPHGPRLSFFFLRRRFFALRSRRAFQALHRKRQGFLFFFYFPQSRMRSSGRIFWLLAFEDGESL